MACEWTAARLTADLDGELDAEEAEKVREHVMRCEACRVERDRLAAVLSAADSWEIGESDVWPAVRDSLDRELEAPFVQELRAMRAEIAALKAEVAGLRRDLARRSPSAIAGGQMMLAYARADEPVVTIM